MSMWSRLTNVFRFGARRARAGRGAPVPHRGAHPRSDGGRHDPRGRGQGGGAPARAVRCALREQSLDVKLLPWLDSMVRDVRLGARMLRQARGGHRRGGDVARARPGRVRRGVFAGRRAGPQAAARRVSPEQLDLPRVSHRRPRAAGVRDVQRSRCSCGCATRRAAHVDLFAMSTQVMRPVRFDGPASEKEPVRTQFVSGDAFDRLGVGAGARDGCSRAQDDRRPGDRSGGGPQPCVLDAAVRRRSGDRRTLVHRWRTVSSQIVGVAEPAVHGRRAGPADGCVAAVRDVQPAGVRQLRLRLVPRVRTAERGTSGVEQAQSVLQAAFTNVRRERAPRRVGPTESPESVARFVDDAAVRALGGQRPVAAARRVRASALDSRRRSRRWSCSSPVRTSPTCSSPEPPRASTRWRCACRSAPAAAG